MRYALENGKYVNIPEDEIECNMKLVNSREEAIQIWLEDNEYIVNEEQEILCQKAKDNRITATIHDAKDVDTPKKREVVRKENPTKEMIISKVADLLKELADDVVIENAAKIVTFNLDGNSYKLDLIQRRAKK
jgi:hypothetical protein